MTRIFYEVIELRKNGATIPDVATVNENFIIHKDGSPPTVNLEWTTKDGKTTKVIGHNYETFLDNTIVISAGEDRYMLAMRRKT